jgi:hypothetical protein
MPLTNIRDIKLHSLAEDGFFVIDDFLDAHAVQKLIAHVESLESDSEASCVRRGVPFARRN